MTINCIIESGSCNLWFLSAFNRGSQIINHKVISTIYFSQIVYPRGTRKKSSIFDLGPKERFDMIKVADFLWEISLTFCKKEVNDSKRNSMKRGSKRRASSRFSIQAAESHESPTRWTNVYTLFSISSRMIIAAGISSLNPYWQILENSSRNFSKFQFSGGDTDRF